MIDRDKVLPHRIATLADERPDETAMLDVAGRSLTWSQLQTEFQRWAGALRAVGTGDGPRRIELAGGVGGLGRRRHEGSHDQQHAEGREATDDRHRLAS